MTAKAPTAATALSVSRRRRWLWLLLLGLPLALLLGSTLVVWYTSDRFLISAIADADRLDPGWRLEELEANRLPFPPNGQNGLDQILAMRAALPQGFSPESKWSFPGYQTDAETLAKMRHAMTDSLSPRPEVGKPSTLLNNEEVRVLLAEQEKTTKALALARDLVNFPYGRTPPINYRQDWYFRGVGAAPFVEAQAAAELLRYHALLRAHADDVASALYDLRAMLHAGRALGDDEPPISQAIRMKMGLRAVFTLERTLGLGETREEELAAMQRELQEEVATPFFLIQIRDARAGLDRYFAAVQNGQITFSKFRQASLHFGIDPREWLGQWHLLQCFLSIRSQRAECLKLMNELVEIAKLPTEEQMSAAGGWETKVDALQAGRLARVLLRGKGTVIIHDLRSKAYLRTALVGVAAERFRLAHGRWPAQVDELVPQYLKAIPADPYDGMPLRLKQGADIFLVYSVGLDTVDNGGLIERGKNMNSPGSDIGFQLFDPAKRRQPARPWMFPHKTQEPDPDGGNGEVKPDRANDERSWQ
jgi:hypothetical protein